MESTGKPSENETDASGSRYQRLPLTLTQLPDYSQLPDREVSWEELWTDLGGSQ